MQSRSFHLEIRTPERTVYEGDVTSVNALGIEGNFQMLYGHIPESSDTPRVMATSGGVFEVPRTGVTALVETAEWASDIDISRAENALERAQEQLTADVPDLNRPQVEAALARAQNRIKVASNS